MTSTKDIRGPAEVLTVDPRSRRRALIGASIGNGIEWYDFAVYGSVAVYIGANFFPSADPVAQLLSSFAAFGLSFLIRPLGGLFFGPLADRIGRKRVMVMVLIMMSAATMGMGLLPTHAAIGVAAPILLVLLRCVQGFSAGGEFGSVSSFLAEHSHSKRKGLSTSWMMFSTVIGFMLGSALTASILATVGENAMAEWGWRIPFLIAGPLGAISLYIRQKLEDSPTFVALEKAGKVSSAPFREVFGYWPSLLTTAGIATLHATAFYVVFTFMVGFIDTNLEHGPGLALTSTLIAGAVALVTLPIMAMVSDQYGRKPVLLSVALGFVVLAYPLYSLAARGGYLEVVIAHATLAFLLAAFISTSVVTYTELFPPRVRSAGVSISYNIPTAVFGGMAPFAATWLVQQTGENTSPAFYLIGAAIVALLAIVFGLSRTALIRSED